MSKKKSNKREVWISLTLIIAIVLVWSFVLFMEIPQQSTLRLDQSECVIEYGHSECIDGNIVTSFYNPSERDITKVSMYFREGEDVDIYNCKEILLPDSTGTLTTVPCTEDMNTDNIWLVWCCGDECSDTYMEDISDDLSLIY